MRVLTPNCIQVRARAAASFSKFQLSEGQLLGFTRNGFQVHGRKRTTEAVYNSLCSQIEKIKLSIFFIVAGFDDSGVAHLIAIEPEEAPNSYDSLGFWAIGTGAPAAINALAFLADKGHFSVYKDVSECVYCICHAKFMAESAREVGKSTFLTIFEHGQDVRFISDLRIQEIRKAWENRGAPQIPKKILQDIPGMIYSMKELREGGFAGLERIMGRIKPPREHHLLREYKALRRTAEASKSDS